jgi:hypothetical protein
MRARLTLDDLDRFLEAPAPGEGEPAAADPFDGYVRAAAVLDVFDPASLRPAAPAPGEPSRADVLARLLPLSEPALAAEPGTWSLSLTARRDALDAMGSREAMQAALAANPGRRATPVQRVFERLIAGESLALDRLSRAELAALLTVLEWVHDLIAPLPARAAVMTALERADLLAPMQRLVRSGFVNREAQLAQVRAYVTESSSPIPLFVHGPGGMGKSTLLARAILDHLETADGAFAYLDIDRPAIRPEFPLTFLTGALAQLQGQLGIDPSQAESLQKELAAAMARLEAGREVESYNANFSFDWHVDAFCDLVGRHLASTPARRILFVVDTFEEALFMGGEVAWGAAGLLRRLAGRLPPLRVVMVGRALPKEGGWEAPEDGPVTVDGVATSDGPPSFDAPLDLAPLDEPAALELLRLELARLEAPPLPEDEALAVLRLVSTNPMCVKLAARVVTAEGGSAALSEDGARHALFSRLKAEKLQAFLYGRVLYHLHDDDVRKVAYPGLVVRRLDPDVIREILAEPCGLTLTAERSEYAIFSDLARESALVEPADDGSVRHRADVRRAMLADLTDHVPADVVTRIDRRAVAFYARRDDDVSRAEELYHRLRLGHSRSTLDKRWRESASRYLRSAGEELRPRERLWLSEKQGATLDVAVRADADQEAWEDQAARAAGRLLRQGLAREALAVLAERTARRPRSPLYALEVEAHRFLGKPQAAADAARRGVEAMSADGAIDQALQLQLTWAGIEEARRAFQTALALLDTAAAMCRVTRDDILRVRTAAARVRVHRHARPAEMDERRVLRAELQALVTDALLLRLRQHPVLLREVAAELAEDDARVAKAAIDTLGIEVQSKDQAEAFAQTIATLAEEEADRVGGDRVITDLLGEGGAGKADAAAIREQVTKKLSGADVRKVAKWLGDSTKASRTLRVARDYFRAGVEQALRGGD